MMSAIHRSEGSMRFETEEGEKARRRFHGRQECDRI